MTTERMIRVCVIDDEPIACRRLQRLLRADPEVTIVQTCTDGEQASEAIRKFHPNLVFLDVQMPKMDGFEVLESIADLPRFPYVIFVTAHDQYAIRAFEYRALDYLLKPFDSKRFTAALERGKASIRQDRNACGNAELFDLLNRLRNRQRDPERLMIRSDGKVYFIKTDDIDWIKANGKHASIHAGHDTYVVREGMKDLETELNADRFLRIHKSAIVNIDRIQHLQPLYHGDYRVFLSDGTTLTVTRKYRQNLDELFGKPL